MQPNVPQQSAAAQAQQNFQQMGQGAGQLAGAGQAVIMNPQIPTPIGAVAQGTNQLMQHPQVQQALQMVGQFLGKIGHPLAQQFNALHGFGGQQPYNIGRDPNFGTQQSNFFAPGTTFGNQQQSGIVTPTQSPQIPPTYQNATNIGNLGGGSQGIPAPKRK